MKETTQLSPFSITSPMNSHCALGRCLSLLMIACFGTFMQTAVFADIWRTSQMTGFSSGNLGAVGAAEGWSGSSGLYTVTSGSGSLDGMGLGLVPSSGDKAEVTAGTGSLNTYDTFANSGQFPVNTATNLYYSFLIRFNNAADVDAAGEQIVSVNRLGSSSGVHFELLARNAGELIQLGANKPTGTAAYATTGISAGTTVFVVVRQQMIVGASDDIIDLWINPDTNTFGLDEGSISAPSISTSNGTEDTSNTGPGRFYLRAGANFTFDELRITSTWAEATPTPAICTPATVTDLADTTVTAGINTTFGVTGGGTSPSYQWQVSTDGGTVWANATGGLGSSSPTFSSPNLTLADDGIQYRCVVSVTCDHSSATSAVATVTVLPPVSTPEGLLVDDRWADGDRTTGPVAISNSVWFASSSSSMVFINGMLYGMPESASSRLWIGYFTEDTTANLPVHLDVGKSLKATWVWNSTQIAATGGNLRLGLFDYADGGTRVTGDNFGSGSTGNGDNVRGYMLTLDYAQTFTDDTPLELRARTILDSVNLMGSTANYPVSLASGPSGMAGATAFLDYTNYTLEITVTRTAPNSVDLTASITGTGTNWTITATDNTYAYHRFDAFAIRPNSQETTAFDFVFNQFKVEVLQAPVTSIPLNIVRSGDNVLLSWVDPRFVLQAAPAVAGTYTNVVGATSPHTVSATGAGRFYRLSWTAQ